MALSKKDLKKVRDFLYDVRLKWYDIGLELEMDQTELDVIKSKYKDDPNDCLREMVSAWLKSFENPPTWEALAEALSSRAVNEKKLAKSSEFVPSSLSYVTSTSSFNSESSNSVASERTNLQSQNVLPVPSFSLHL